jgi:hypothetical protein
MYFFLHVSQSRIANEKKPLEITQYVCSSEPNVSFRDFLFLAEVADHP